MIRVATTNDSEALNHVALQAYSKYLDFLLVPPDPLLLDYEQVAKDGNTYVLEDEDDILGMVTFNCERHRMVLRNLAVLPSRQGKGYGKRLADYVESRAIEEQLSTIELWTRQEMSDNINFYLRLGYEITREENREGCSRVFFRKQTDCN